MTGARVRSAEFADCELGSLQRTGEKISRTRFSDCQLVSARFEDVTLDHVIFADCTMDCAMLSRIRAAGPVMFAACSFREAEFDGCALTGSLFTRCDFSPVSAAGAVPRVPGASCGSGVPWRAWLRPG